MNEIRLDLNGMTCGACEKIIQRVIEQNNAEVKTIDSSNGFILISCNDGDLSSIKKQLAQKGFPERVEGEAQRGDYKRIKNYISAVIAGEDHVKVEAKLINYALGATAITIILGSIFYMIALNQLNNALEYVPLLLLAAIAAVSTISSSYHMRCYNKRMTCTNGMMVGMTMGMISGFTIGALIGATNGMFVGSTIGMLFGIALGTTAGKCSGIMGAMEGVMAGLMAGIMGAMTSVMMLNDNMVAFLYVLFGVCTFVLGGLSYMMYREAGSANHEELKLNFAKFTALSVVLGFGLMVMMVYGPKGPLTYI